MKQDKMCNFSRKSSFFQATYNIKTEEKNNWFNFYSLINYWLVTQLIQLQTRLVPFSFRQPWTDARRTGWFPFRDVTKSGRVRLKGPDNEAWSLAMPMPELHTMVSGRKNWKKDSAESSLMWPPDDPFGLGTELKWL